MTPHLRGGFHMQARSLTIPEIAIIGGTRIALGVGIGLLISRRLNRSQREAAGLALVAVGILTTIPLVIGILGKRAVSEEPIPLPA